MTLRSRGDSSAKNSSRGSPRGAEQVDLLDQALDRPCHAGQSRTPCKKDPRARGMVVAVAAIRLHACPPSRSRHHTTAPDGALAPIALGPGEGEHFWFFGGLTTIKADGARTGGRMMLTEQTAPRGSGSPLHVHHNEDEWFYVLEGELTIWVDGPDGRRSGRLVRVRPARRAAHVRRQLRRGALPAGHAGGRVRGLHPHARDPGAASRRSRPRRPRRPTWRRCCRPPPTTASRSSALPASRPEERP